MSFVGLCCVIISQCTGQIASNNKKSVTGVWHQDAFSRKFYGFAGFEVTKATEGAKIDTFVVLHFLIRIALPSGTVCDRIYSNYVGRKLEKDLTLN
jgi:hypothetical protein